MKKRILVMPDGNWLSHTSRPLEIAKELRRMGHEVIFASEGEYMKLPREEGFETVPIITIDPARVLACSRSGRANWYAYDLIQACVAAELALFEQVQPDMVLTDFRLPLSTSCELAGIPLAVILNASWTNHYTAPLKAPEHLAITRLLGKRIADWFIPWIKRFIITYDARPFNQFRREQGLGPRRNIWDVWRGDLNLIADIPEYGPTANLPDDFHYIGPIVWEPEMAAPAWLDQLDPERPTLYFSMGSTGYARFFEQAIELYEDSAYQCIMTTAGMVTLPHVPDNFFVTEYAPGSKIMAKSDIVICHGGNGTIYQAMSQGTPIIGIPTMHDQEFNLDRVEELGIGIHLSELTFKPAHLLEAIQKVLSGREFKTNARRLQQILANYNAPKQGATLIASF
ncbi:MAG: glycosyltransferase [Anaerolineae bacterium]|nr:glycosyltransferase [Anaerolineae bacterium]